MGLSEKELCGLGMEVLATATGGLFSGACLYISLVDHPSRMSHDPAFSITMFRPTILRAGKLQLSLAFVSGAAGVCSFACSYGTAKHSWAWLGTGAIMLFMFPYTFFCLVPLNDQLLETDRNIRDRGDSWIAQNLSKWGRLHGLRTVLSVGAFAFMTYRLSRR